MWEDLLKKIRKQLFLFKGFQVQGGVHSFAYSYLNLKKVVLFSIKNTLNLHCKCVKKVPAAYKLVIFLKIQFQSLTTPYLLWSHSLVLFISHIINDWTFISTKRDSQRTIN